MKTKYLVLIFIVFHRPLSAQILELNTLDADVQSFTTSTTGTNFSITSSMDIHTFILPDAGTGARGVVTTVGQTFGGDKTFANRLFLSTGSTSLPSLAFSSGTTTGFSYSSSGSGEAINGSFTAIQRFEFTDEGKFILSNIEEFDPKLDINVYHDSNEDSGDPQDGGVNITTYGGDACSPGPDCKTSTFTGRTASGSKGDPGETQLDQAMAEFSGKGYTGTDFETANKGVFGVYAAETHAATANGTYCAIKTTRIGTTNSHFSMLINSDGNAGLTYNRVFETSLPAGWATSGDSRFFSIESRTTTEDAGILIQNGTLTSGAGVEGLNLWMDNSANITYFDNLQNTDGAYSLFRLKTVGTPLNALSIAYSTTIGTCIGTGGNITAAPASKIHIDAGNALGSEVRWTAGTTTGQASSDGFTVGITTSAVAEIRQRENEDMWLYTNNAIRLSLLSAGHIVTGSTKENRYRTTDGGTNVNSHFYIDPTSSSGTGSFSWGFDAANNFFCTQLNAAGTPKRVMGMAIKPVSISTAAGDEAMAMTFFTQTDGLVATEKVRITDIGNVGVGLTLPTAVLNIKAGTATTSTAPLKFTSGTNLTTAEAGAVEYNNSFYQTKNSGLRYGVGGAIFENFENADNSGTSETDLYSYTTPASAFANNGEKIIAHYVGLFNTFNEEGIIKVYFAGSQIFTSGTLSGSSGTATAFNIEVTIIRTGTSSARSIVSMLSPFRGSGLIVTETDLTGITFTTSNVLKITGQSPTGGSGDITAKFATGFWYPTSNN